MIRGPVASVRALATRRAIWLLALAFLGVLALAWWTIPAATSVPFVPVPVLSEQRLIELKALGVHSARIRGLDASALANGTTVRLVAGYMDERRLVLFLRIDPPARLATGTTTLRDQFGRSYASGHSVADTGTGEQVLFFDAPRFPLVMTGARLWLESSQIERGVGPERRDVRVSLATILLADGSTIPSFLASMAMNYVALATVAAVFLGIIHGGARILPIKRGARGAYLRGVTTSTLFAVVAVPTFIAIAALFRYDPFGFGGQQRAFETYWNVARAVFFGVEGTAVAIAFVRGMAAAGRAVPIAAATTALVFLGLTLPLAEFANACYIGRGFILEPSC